MSQNTVLVHKHQTSDFFIHIHGLELKSVHSELLKLDVTGIMAIETGITCSMAKR